MELRASGEDYLEAVLILDQRMDQVRAIDIARYLGYARPASAMDCASCARAGSSSGTRTGYLYLTEVGQETAEKIYAKHRFFTQWLIEAGVAPDTAEKDACRMEHAISEGNFCKLMRELEHSKEIP